VMSYRKINIWWVVGCIRIHACEISTFIETTAMQNKYWQSSM